LVLPMAGRVLWGRWRSEPIDTQVRVAWQQFDDALRRRDWSATRRHLTGPSVRLLEDLRAATAVPPPRSNAASVDHMFDDQTSYPTMQAMLGDTERGVHAEVASVTATNPNTAVVVLRETGGRTTRVIFTKEEAWKLDIVATLAAP